MTKKIDLKYFFFEKNAFHTISIDGNCMTGFFDGDTKVFSSNFENLPQKLVVFFSTANRILYANKQFNFLCA